MNIDKFGRSIFTKQKQVQLIKETFPRDADGHFIFNHKRLKQLHAPLEDVDASNKLYVDTQVKEQKNHILPFIHKQDGQIQNLTRITSNLQQQLNDLYAHTIFTLHTVLQQPKKSTKYILSTGDDEFNMPVSGQIRGLTVLCAQTDGIIPVIDVYVGAIRLSTTRITHAILVGSKTVVTNTPISIVKGDKITFVQKDKSVPKCTLYITIEVQYKLQHN